MPVKGIAGASGVSKRWMFGALAEDGGLVIQSLLINSVSVIRTFQI
jgi:hypothetical protein